MQGLDKHIDQALVGKNYLSLLMGLGQVKRGQKVLLVDDTRLGLGKEYLASIGLTERYFLQTWAHDEEIRGLVNLKQLLRSKQYYFIVGKRRLRLGGTPSENLLELVRKFPAVFKEELLVVAQNFGDEPTLAQAFDDEFINFCERLGQSIFRFKGPQNLRTVDFLAICPKKLKEVYESLLRVFDGRTGLSQEKLWELKTLIYLARGCYHRRLSLHATQFELFHLLICLLSPRFSLDLERMELWLSKEFEERGGRVKRTQISDWHFDKGVPWAICFSNFAGVFHPRFIKLFGGKPEKLPIELEPLPELYMSANVEMKSDVPVESELVGQRFHLCSLDQLGTAYPYAQLIVRKDGYGARIFVERQDADKIEFARQKVVNLFWHFISEMLTNMEQIRKGCTEMRVFFGEDLCTSEGKVKLVVGRKMDAPIPKYPKLYETPHLGRRGALKHVTYFGPCREGALGLLSTLMNIREGE